MDGSVKEHGSSAKPEGRFDAELDRSNELFFAAANRAIEQPRDTPMDERGSVIADSLKAAEVGLRAAGELERLQISVYRDGRFPPPSTILADQTAEVQAIIRSGVDVNTLTDEQIRNFLITLTFISTFRGFGPDQVPGTLAYRFSEAVGVYSIGTGLAKRFNDLSINRSQLPDTRTNY